MRQHMVQYGKANRSSVLELLLSFFAEYAAAIRKWSEDRSNGSRQAAHAGCPVCILPALDESNPESACEPYVWAACCRLAQVLAVSVVEMQSAGAVLPLVCTSYPSTLAMLHPCEPMPT